MTSQFQLEPPTSALSPLLELRDYYTRLVEEYERNAALARTQLVHVEALLSNWYSLDLSHNQTTVETVAEEPTSFPEDSLFIEEPLGISSIELEEPIQSKLKDNDQQEIVLDRDSSEDVNTPSFLPDTSPVVKTAVENNDNSMNGLEVPILPHYQALNRMEAIKKLLQEHVGTVCHIDFIVRSLYGDLEPSLFKVVKGRVHSSLTHGKEQNYWASVPEEPGCYTLDLNLVTPTNGKVRPKTVQPKKKKPFILPKAKRVPMLPEFQGKFLIDAICSLLKQNPGKIFSVAEIIAGLYGKLDSTQLREIKSTVLGELSRGYRIGRFSRVPDKVGFYTWDLNVIPDSSLN